MYLKDLCRILKKHGMHIDIMHESMVDTSENFLHDVNLALIFVDRINDENSSAWNFILEHMQVRFT